MGRYPSDDSKSPVRVRESHRKRSPSRKERSPARHKSSYSANSPIKKNPTRTRTPRVAMSRSPEKSRVREKLSSKTSSPRPAKSRSPVSRSPVKDKPFSHTRSSRHVESSHSAVRDKPSGRVKSPSRPRSNSPVQYRSSRERANRTRSPKPPKSISPAARSPSPRTKRLRRAKYENEAEIASKRMQKTNHRGSERSAHMEKELESGEPSVRKDKKSGRDIGNGSSRSKRERSTSPSDYHHVNRNRSRSPPDASQRRARDEVNNSRGSDHRNTDDDSVAKMAAAAEALEKKEKQKPSFELSGKLAEETNRFRGITLLFNEAPDARKPDIRWRLYVFKGGDVLNEPLYVHRQTSYLFGRERRVADIPTDHPSCSKQHAVLQYRQVEIEQADGTLLKQVRPYIMDLGSTNGTFINDERIDPQRYYELREKDTIKFGNSSREYVLLHEHSAG